MNERIVRVMPLPTRVDAHDEAGEEAVLARFRLRIVPPMVRIGPRLSADRVALVDVGQARVLGLDTVNPHGGVGGSLDSEQVAWLVRQLDAARDRYVIVATHHSSLNLTSDRSAYGLPSRIMGPEFESLLLAHRQVIGWVSATMHHRAGRRHGDASHGFWELPGATEGRDAPLAGGLEVVRLRDRPTVVLRGALDGATRPVWELRDPLAATGAERPTAPAVALR